MICGAANAPWAVARVGTDGLPLEARAIGISHGGHPGGADRQHRAGVWTRRNQRRVRRGEPWLVCLTLKCLGKDRGYVCGGSGRGSVVNRSRPTASRSSSSRGDKTAYIARLRQLRVQAAGSHGPAGVAVLASPPIGEIAVI